MGEPKGKLVQIALIGSLFFLIFMVIGYAEILYDDFETYDSVNASDLSFNSAYPHYTDSVSENVLVVGDDWNFGVSRWDSTPADDEGIRSIESNSTYGSNQLYSISDYNQNFYWEWYLLRAMYLGEDSTLRYDTYRSGSNSVPNQCVMFVNSTSPYCLIVERSGGGNCVGWRNYCNTSGNVNTWPYDVCEIMYQNSPVSGADGQFVERSSVTISDCVDYYGNESFDRIIVSQMTSSVPPVLELGMDNLRLADIGWVPRSSNTLPTFELDYLHTICMDFELGYVDWNLSVNATDLEGDQIYYANEITDKLARYVQHEEKFHTGSYRRDYGFFNRGNFISDCATPSNMFDIFTDFLIKDFGTTYVLMVTKSCGNWSYVFDEPINDVATISYDSYFLWDGTEFSTLVKNADDEILNITYIQNATAYRIEIDGDEVYNEDAVPGEDNWVNTVILTNPNSSRIFAIFTGNDGQLSVNYSMGSNSVDHLQFMQSDTILYPYYIDNLYAKGWVNMIVPDFSTNVPSSVRFNETGNYKINFFISDEYHQPEEYNGTAFYVSVITDELECQYWREVDTTDPLKAVRTLFADLVRNYNLSTVLTQGVWMLFFLISGTLIWKTRTATFPFFIASLVCLLFSIALLPDRQTLAFVILTAISGSVFLVVKK